MNLDIKNLRHTENDVAKHFKSTKKQFIWEFILDDKKHKIELFDSKLSGKKKVLKDGLTLIQTEEDKAFIKSFDVGKHNCTLIQHGEKYELRIDNQSFNHLMDLEKNRLHFSNTAPTSTTFIARNVNNDDNKIGFGLTIGNSSKPNDQKPGLFNFSIKPSSQSTVQQKRFSFAVNDNNNKQEFTVRNEKNVKPLIDIPNSLNELNYQVPVTDSKSQNKTIDIRADNQDIFDIFAGNTGTKITDNQKINETSNMNQNFNNYSGNENNNQLISNLENLYKNVNTYQKQNSNQTQMTFNQMYGIPQIGDGNLNSDYNPYMVDQYSQMQQLSNQSDYNKNQFDYSQSTNIQNFGFGKSQMNYNNNIQSQVEPIDYPTMQSGTYPNISGGVNLNLIHNKNLNKDPLSDLFG